MARPNRISMRACLHVLTCVLETDLLQEKLFQDLPTYSQYRQDSWSKSSLLCVFSPNGSLHVVSDQNHRIRKVPSSHIPCICPEHDVCKGSSGIIRFSFLATCAFPAHSFLLISQKRALLRLSDFDDTRGMQCRCGCRHALLYTVVNILDPRAHRTTVGFT